ncbi:DUF883 family protein [Alkalilimnicola sp. S0819]|uniref:DUF883 family protein n=1 Tax=Alkalilimnicola sp. S0819 TaxID=2613922 RepID=UPI001261FCD9|nr:DUF883 family protein [Alkalilimnicola sp. S0819]KAB7627344.1 DUF883 family protein [Alkalilimnicola sp. S0819]MPQ16061.1 DUF883 family protein [Alkalilimnicola sp. S0819]
MAEPNDTNTKQGETPITDRAARAAHEAIDRLSVQGGRAEEGLRSGSRYAEARGQDLMAQACSYVREKPLQSLGIAAAAGFLLATLTRRR